MRGGGGRRRPAFIVAVAPLLCSARRNLGSTTHLIRESCASKTRARVEWWLASPGHNLLSVSFRAGQRQGSRCSWSSGQLHLPNRDGALLHALPITHTTRIRPRMTAPPDVFSDRLPRSTSPPTDACERRAVRELVKERALTRPSAQFHTLGFGVASLDSDPWKSLKSAVGAGGGASRYVPNCESYDMPPTRKEALLC